MVICEMGCQQTKGLEKDWQNPSSHSPPPSSTDGGESLVVSHAKNRISAIGAPVLEYYDYSVKRFLQEGGMGSVYYGVRRSDQLPVALKFFGYTHRAPSEESIREEIRVMMALRNVDGVVHLHGTFLDSATGYIEGKRFPIPRPVLVMDFLEGGDLCDRIMQMSTVSESDLANVFRQILWALQGIHGKGYIHRDLKLENIMLLNQKPDSPIRLIDFGMMIELPAGQEVVVAKVALGTAGYIAPESILRKEYSFKSDVWQAGCCLYNLLSGHFPFNPDNPAQVCDHPFFPMVGEDWARISDSAKKLVESMLEKDPKKRPSIETLLSHPWLVGETASQSDLGKRYSMRIKNLSLRRKLKRFFVNNDVTLANQRKKLEAIIPTLKMEGAQQAGSNLRSPLDVFGEEQEAGTISQEKLDNFQNLMMNALQAAPTRKTHLRSTPSGRLLSERPKEEVNYEKFCSILKQADLSELASESVFAIFDSNNTGTIDLKEFLLTMLAFRPLPPGTSGASAVAEGCKATGEGEVFTVDDDVIRLYFNLFDLNRSGRIDHEELKLCLENMLPEEFVRARSFSQSQSQSQSQQIQLQGSGESADSPERNSTASLANHIFEMFLAVDTSKDGYIDFAEFKQFYVTIMNNTSSHFTTATGGVTPAMSVPSADVVEESEGDQRGQSPPKIRSRSPSPSPSRSPPRLSPLPFPKTPPRSASPAPARAHSPLPQSHSPNSSSASPTELSQTPPNPISETSPKPQVRKGTSAGVASRIQGLDPSKIILPGMGMPPKKLSSPAPLIKHSTSLPPDLSSGVVNVEPLLSRGVLKTKKPRRRMTVRRNSSARLESLSLAIDPIPEARLKANP